MPSRLTLRSGALPLADGVGIRDVVYRERRAHQKRQIDGVFCVDILQEIE